MSSINLKIRFYFLYIITNYGKFIFPVLYVLLTFMLKLCFDTPFVCESQEMFPNTPEKMASITPEKMLEKFSGKSLYAKFAQLDGIVEMFRQEALNNEFFSKDMYLKYRGYRINAYMLTDAEKHRYLDNVFYQMCLDLQQSRQYLIIILMMLALVFISWAIHFYNWGK